MNIRLLSAQAVIVFLVVLFLLTGCIKYVPACDMSRADFSYDNCYATTQGGK